MSTRQPLMAIQAISKGWPGEFRPLQEQVDSHGLHPCAYNVLITLLGWCDANYEVQISFYSLSQESEVSPQAVHISIATLTRLKLIEKERGELIDSRPTPNLYRVDPIACFGYDPVVLLAELDQAGQERASRAVEKLIERAGAGI